MRFGKLDAVPAMERLDLLAAPATAAVQALGGSDVQVTEIDPQFADTAAFCEHYDIPLEHSANCVVVEVTRGDKTWLAACVVLASTRADVNGLVRRHLGARGGSFGAVGK